MSAPTDLGVYLVTDPVLVDRHGRGVLGVVRAAVDAGVRLVQVRDKQAPVRDLLALTVAVADAVGDRATVVVDDRTDVALAARRAGHRVAGVHLGQSDLPVAAARALLGPDAHVGLTANTPATSRPSRSSPAARSTCSASASCTRPRRSRTTHRHSASTASPASPERHERSGSRASRSAA